MNFLARTSSFLTDIYLKYSSNTVHDTITTDHMVIASSPKSFFFFFFFYLVAMKIMPDININKNLNSNNLNLAQNRDFLFQNFFVGSNSQSVKGWK